MKNLKSFDEFLNEAKLPITIKNKLRLNPVFFEQDEDWTDEGDDRFEHLMVYTGEDKKTRTNWVIKVGETSKGFMLEIAENDSIVFTNEYMRDQKVQFEKDCMDSIGFLPID